MAAQTWSSYHPVTVGESVVLRTESDESKHQRDAEANCDVCKHRHVNNVDRVVQNRTTDLMQNVRASM